jgi:hypothetical protein
MYGNRSYSVGLAFALSYQSRQVTEESWNSCVKTTSLDQYYVDEGR